MKLPEFLAKHTCWAITSTSLSLKISNESAAGKRVYAVVGNPRFCITCAREQVREFGFSFWLRKHMVPGQLWCHIHGDALIEVEVDGRTVFWQPPTVWVGVGIQSDNDLLDAWKANRVIQSYLVLANHFVENPIQLNRSVMQQALAERAQTLDIRCAPASMDPRSGLSERLGKVTDYEWLSSVSSVFSCSRQRSVLDGMLYVHDLHLVQPRIFLLTAALVHETTEDALKTIRGSALRVRWPFEFPERDITDHAVVDLTGNLFEPPRCVPEERDS
jgi:hypothetical protein